MIWMTLNKLNEYHRMLNTQRYSTPINKCTYVYTTTRYNTGKNDEKKLVLLWFELKILSRNFMRSVSVLVCVVVFSDHERSKLKQSLAKNDVSEWYRCFL